MTTQFEQLEREKLLEIAQEYRQKGYEVIISPNNQEIPDFLRNYSYLPDMIARRGEEGIVIEVKSRRSMIESGKNLQRIAHLIEEKPSWKFELLMINPEDALYSSKVEDLLQAQEIRSKLQLAKELTNNYPESAIVYVWSLTEATLRLIAYNEGLSLQKQLHSPIGLLKQLATEGIISQTDYQFLIEVFPLRNAIAHGFKTTAISSDYVFEIIEVTEQLLNSIDVNETEI